MSGRADGERRITTIAFDLGDRRSAVCLLFNGGACKRDKVSTTPEGVGAFLRSMPRSLVVMEAGAHSFWVSGIARCCGHEVVVANPRRLRLLTRSHKKSDRTDAELLARMAAADRTLLSPVRTRSPQSQAHRATLRARDALIKSRSRIINHVRGATKVWGVRVPACSTPAFAKRARLALPAELEEALAGMLSAIEDLTRRIGDADKYVEALATTTYAECQRLRQITGVGPLTALSFILTIDDPRRFVSGRHVAAYLGLCPRLRETGGHRAQLPISKAGDEYLRRLLISCAHYILGSFGQDSDLRRWGLKLCRRGWQYPKAGRRGGRQEARRPASQAVDEPRTLSAASRRSDPPSSQVQKPLLGFVPISQVLTQ